MFGLSAHLLIVFFEVSLNPVAFLYPHLSLSQKEQPRSWLQPSVCNEPSQCRFQNCPKRCQCILTGILTMTLFWVYIILHVTKWARVQHYSAHCGSGSVDSDNRGCENCRVLLRFGSANLALSPDSRGGTHFLLLCLIWAEWVIFLSFRKYMRFSVLQKLTHRNKDIKNGY